MITWPIKNSRKLVKELIEVNDATLETRDQKSDSLYANENMALDANSGAVRK